MHPYSSIDVTAAWKKLRFILSVRSDFNIVDSLLIAVHAFVNLVSMSFSADSTLLPRYVNLSTSLRGGPSRVEMSPVLVIAHIFRFVCINMEAYACCCLVPGYAEVFRLGQVYLPVSLCHRRSRASVIVVAGYLLLLFFVSSKPFSLILSIDVLST